MEPRTTLEYRNERHILRQTVAALRNAGYELRVDDGGETSELLPSPDAVVEHVTWDDKGRGRHLWNLGSFRVIAKNADGRHFVLFVMDNGSEGLECIADYSTGLDPVLRPVMEAAEGYADEMEGGTRPRWKGARV